MKIINKSIKSIGFGFEDCVVLDDSRGLDVEYMGGWDDGELVSFEEGLKKVEECIREWEGFESEDDKNEKVKEVKNRLVKLKEELNKMGVLRGSDSWKCWVLWSLEYDVNLGIRVKDVDKIVEIDDGKVWMSEISC